MPSPPEGPLYVIGRQHSGNTLLATMLGRHPSVYPFTGEGTFFEHQSTIRQEEDPVPRVVAEVAGGADPPLPSEIRKALVQFLRSEQDGELSVSSLYARGKERVAASEGADRWVQKATSYVFHVDDILRALPASRLLFLLRNPLDLGASLKRRGGWYRVLRMVWGWNRGVRLAHRWAEDERVLLVRYEDLVRQSESVLREVCSFVGLSFDEALLRVPHVNRSETPYNTDSSSTGLDDSRVYYYEEVLSPEEEAIVRDWVDAGQLHAAYPDLPEARSPRTVRRVSRSAGALGGLVRTLVSDHGSALLQNPGHVIDRIRRRL